VPITVADCERVQTGWFRLRAETLGGCMWNDGPLTWIAETGTLWLMFPRELPAPAIERGIAVARDLGVASIGAWLSLDVDATPLSAAGFEHGWSPWWMTASLADVAGPPDPRIELRFDPADYNGEHADYRAEVALTRLTPPRAWYAAARAGKGRRFAGRAWSFLDSPLAGVFDMAIWPPFRRRGLGTGVLRAVCAAAADAGATDAVLNATPEGKLLYSASGFTQIGEGITWWLHLS
jgi:GNAT superfamily N-acetyltransferase